MSDLTTVTALARPQPGPRPAPRRDVAPEAPLGAVQGALALDLFPRLDPPAPPAEADVLSLDASLEGRVRRDIESWAYRFTQAAVEVAGGDRPVSQLLRWTTTAVYQDLDRRAQLVARARVHGSSDQPVGRRHPATRPQVMSVHSCVLSPTVVEVGSRVRHGRRSRAVAARFELDRGRWRCTALDFA